MAMAALYDDPGLPTTLISAAEVAALHPLVDVSTVEAGIYTTQDGDVCPTLLTTCLAKLAQTDGASIVHNAEVDTVTRQPNGTFTVSTVNGALYQADAVVNAAGLWSRKFSRQLGLEDTHPAFVIEHQYAITETIPALKGKVRTRRPRRALHCAISRAISRAGTTLAIIISTLDPPPPLQPTSRPQVRDGERVPCLRDLAGSSYIRQERDGLLIGPYEGLLSPHQVMSTYGVDP